MPIFDTPTDFNITVVLEGLQENDLRTGMNVFEAAIEPNTKACCFRTIATGAELLASLAEIEKRCLDPSEPWRPVVQIDCHGSPEGFQVGPGAELVPWTDIDAALRRINVACGNRLIVVLAGCHSSAVLGAFNDIKDRCPFFAALATVSEVPAGKLQEELVAFYRRLFELRNLNDAAKGLSTLHLVLTEQIIVDAALRYLVEMCSGAAKKKRNEKILTKLKMRREREGRPVQLARLRRYAKRALSHDNFNFDEWYGRYVMADDDRNTGRFSVRKAHVGDIFKARVARRR